MRIIFVVIFCLGVSGCFTSSKNESFYSHGAKDVVVRDNLVGLGFGIYYDDVPASAPRNIKLVLRGKEFPVVFLSVSNEGRSYRYMVDVPVAVAPENSVYKFVYNEGAQLVKTDDYTLEYPATHDGEIFIRSKSPLGSRVRVPGKGQR